MRLQPDMAAYRVGVVHAAVHFLFFYKTGNHIEKHILYKHGIIFTSRNKWTNEAEKSARAPPLQILHCSFLHQERTQSSSSSKQKGTEPLTAPFDWFQDYTHAHTCGPVPPDCSIRWMLLVKARFTCTPPGVTHHLSWGSPLGSTVS